MTSRRRRPARWPWAMLVLLAVVMGALWIWIGDDPADASATPPPAATATPVSGPAAQPGAFRPTPARPVADPAPRPAAQARPAVPGITLETPGAPAPSSVTAARPASDLPQPPSVLTPSRPTAAPAPEGTGRPTDSRYAQGLNLIAEGKLVEGRRVLSELLAEEGRLITRAEATVIRDTLTSVNDKLVFSPDVLPNDPLVETYAVQSGDMLVRLAPRYKVPYQFIERINGIDASKLRVGQRLKMIKGPFHVRVVKTDYRLDLYLNGPDGRPIYIRSFPVGLGEFDSTPEGNWIVEPNRKVQNPAWNDVRTGRSYGRDDPQNPIGEYWVALKGMDENTSRLSGYGIHGTIEPESIGTQASLGCVRLRPADIEQVYYMLVEGDSTVQIVR